MLSRSYRTRPTLQSPQTFHANPGSRGGPCRWNGAVGLVPGTTHHPTAAEAGSGFPGSGAYDLTECTVRFRARDRLCQA